MELVVGRSRRPLEARRRIECADSFAGAARGMGAVLLGGAVLLLGIVLSCAEASESQQSPAGAATPNVLLISLDSTRRDLLSAYGHEAVHAPGVPTSPVLDQLAAEGVLFENAYATTSWTLPSHWSLLTGEPELVHGVDLDHQRPSQEVVPIAETLAQAGYRTAGFFSGPYLDPQFGFDRGFERYEACYGDDLTKAAARRDDPGGAAALELESHRDVSTGIVVEGVLGELALARDSEQPFFVFAHFFDPHYDHVAPEPFATRFDPDYGPSSASGAGAGGPPWGNFLGNEALSVLDPTGQFGERVQTVSERGLENVWAGYAGELAWTDAGVGKILAGLEQLDLADNTLVIVVADHGEEFFEHGGLGHRRTLYGEVLAVPLILRLPGVLPAGSRVSGVACTTQIVPTILDVLGLAKDGDRVPHSGSLLTQITAGEDSSEPALGRFVGLQPAFLTLRNESGQATARVNVQRVHLLESWIDGDLKLLRRVSWLEPGAGVTALQADQVSASRGRAMRQEELLWIDLVEHPEESLEDYSTDFSDARAAAALSRFQFTYAQLLDRRKEAVVLPATDLDPQLDALGYTGHHRGRNSKDALGSSMLSLPIPGKL